MGAALVLTNQAPWVPGFRGAAWKLDCDTGRCWLTSRRSGRRSTRIPTLSARSARTSSANLLRRHAARRQREGPVAPSVTAEREAG